MSQERGSVGDKEATEDSGALALYGNRGLAKSHRIPGLKQHTEVKGVGPTGEWGVTHDISADNCRVGGRQGHADSRHNCSIGEDWLEHAGPFEQGLRALVSLQRELKPEFGIRGGHRLHEPLSVGLEIQRFSFELDTGPIASLGTHVNDHVQVVTANPIRNRQ